MVMNNGTIDNVLPLLATWNPNLTVSLFAHPSDISIKGILGAEVSTP